jgi:hypothetical protein
LALQRGRLGVDPPGQNQIAIETFDGLVVEIEGIVGVLTTFAFRGE